MGLLMDLFLGDTCEETKKYSKIKQNENDFYYLFEDENENESDIDLWDE